MHQEALNEKGKEIFPYLKQFQDFYLVGGTALALQIGHRISVDFDLFSNKPIQKSLLNKAKKVFTGKSIDVVVNNPDELTLFADGMKITFFHNPFPVINPFINYAGTRMWDIQEIAASKAFTIGRRGSLKDYIDLYFILSEKHLTLEDIIKLAEQKYGNEFNSRLFLEQLVYLKDIEEMDIVFLKPSVDKNSLENFFIEEIKKIDIEKL